MWSPKNGNTTLDSLKPGQYPSFKYILFRNGHAVALFIKEESANAKMRERERAIPADLWTVGHRSNVAA